jgi:hypothetical protein
MPEESPDIAAVRAARRKPTTGERWDNWKRNVARWDKRIWWVLGIWTGLCAFTWFGAWQAKGVEDARTQGMVTFAETLVGDRDAQATGNEAEMSAFLAAVDDPFESWKGECSLSSHAQTVVGVSSSKNGESTGKLHRARSWKLVMAVQRLGPVDLQNVYIGNVNGEIIASPTPTDDAPGKLCFKPVPPQAGDTSTTTGATATTVK